ncbi:hypothetical protein CDES_03025 [Corynebacterium deserti GIMN1.010]|uniref:WXG100 family type VII secretion target n=1 Tax=Corynebacterium deserti GIMN1.010 TaxID=931089 RepID=A0A0M4CH39_9CORY|nr:hypothetical protein CDES_03025 [Corynebacterium deserti GIMN1.010]
MWEPAGAFSSQTFMEGKFARTRKKGDFHVSGFELQVDATLSALRGLLGETAQQRDTHHKHRPNFAPSAAGRGFGAQGRALADMFEGLHGGVEKRIDALTRTTRAARSEVERFAESDGAFATDVDGVDVA